VLIRKKIEREKNRTYKILPLNVDVSTVAICDERHYLGMQLKEEVEAFAAPTRLK